MQGFLLHVIEMTFAFYLFLVFGEKNKVPLALVILSLVAHSIVLTAMVCLPYYHLFRCTDHILGICIRRTRGTYLTRIHLLRQFILAPLLPLQLISASLDLHIGYPPHNSILLPLLARPDPSPHPPRSYSPCSDSPILPPPLRCTLLSLTSFFYQ